MDTGKQKYRSIFPHTSSGHIYLNHAAISPLSTRVTSRLLELNRERSSGVVENFEAWIGTVEETRSIIAKLIHAPGTERITFMGNTSDAISAVAEGMEWNRGDEIILNTMEFPSNVQPFRILEKKGVRLIYLEPNAEGAITPGAIEHAITNRTKMVSISAVQYLGGFRADLKSIGDLCKKHNLQFVVDGIQALGAVDIDVEKCNIDALATGAHKWLMAPMGTGFLYISEKMEQVLAPAKTGWLSVETPWELTNFNQNWLPVSKHLETGTFNISGIYGLNASLKNLLETGIETIENEIRGLCNKAFDILSNDETIALHTPTNPVMRAGIVTFSKIGMEKPEEFVLHLKEKKITISAREGLIRISPHYYNTVDEIEEVLAHILD